MDTNDPANRKVTLVCKGELLEAVKLQPRIANFGRIYLKEGVVPERKITISRGAAGPLKPKIRPIKGNQVTAELRTLEEGEKYELIVHAHPKANANTVRGKIAVTTGVAEEPTVNINVFGTVVPRVSTRPNSFVVPTNADSDWKQSVELVWNQGKPGKLLSATTNSPKLHATVFNEGKRRRVELCLTEALDKSGLPAQLEVHVTTDDEKAADLAIPVRYRSQRSARRAKKRAAAASPRSLRIAPKPATSPAAPGAATDPGMDGATSAEKKPAGDAQKTKSVATTGSSTTASPQ